MIELMLYGNVFHESALQDSLAPFLSKPAPLQASLTALRSLSYLQVVEVPGINPTVHEQGRHRVIEEKRPEPWIVFLSPERAVFIDRVRIWNPRCYVEVDLTQPSLQNRAFLQWFTEGKHSLDRCRTKSAQLCGSRFRRGGDYEAGLGKTKRKTRGAFYTPEWLARRMVYEILAGASPRSSAEVLSLRVLDPAMGAAHFLLAALDALAWSLCCAWSREQSLSSITRGLWLKAKRTVASRCLYGVEVDPSAADLGRELILDHCEGHGETERALQKHLRTGHSLLSLPFKGQSQDDYETEQRKFCSRYQLDETGFSFPLAFPELFFGADGDARADPGFDFVLGNPPYLSFGLKGVGRLDKEARAVYLALFSESAEYKISIYALFVELGQRLLRSEGQLYYVLPDSFLLGRYFSKLRGQLLAKGERLVSLTLFGESFWDVTVGLPVLLRTTKRAQKTLTWRFSGRMSDFLKNTKIREHSLCSSLFESTSRHRFYMVLSEAEEAFLKTLLRDVGCLDDWLRLFSGLIAKRGGKKDLIGREGRPGWGRVMEKGASLGAFSLTPGDTWVRKDGALYRSGYAPEDYENPKLLLNQTGFRLKAAVDVSGLYVFNNHHVGVPRSRVDAESLDILDFVAGVLNSQVAAVLYEFLAMEGGRAMAQVDLDVMRDFPMPKYLSSTVVKISQSLRLNDADSAAKERLEMAVLDAYQFDPGIFDAVKRRVLGERTSL